MKRHLIVALNNKGFGESILGVNLALELQQAGDQVLFLAHDSNSRLLGTRFQHAWISDAASPLLTVYLDECLNRFQPSSIILSDYAASTVFLKSLGLTLNVFTSRGIPVFAIDTWGLFRIPERDTEPADSGNFSPAFRRRGDAGDKEVRRLVPHVHDLNENWCNTVKPLCPVPFLAQGTAPEFYCSLPNTVSRSTTAWQQCSHMLNISPGAKVVFICTSPWQHVAEWQAPSMVRDRILDDAQKTTQPGDHSTDNGWARAGAQWHGARCLAASLPVLVVHYMSLLGNEVHLVHVGPRSFEFGEQLRGRYHWLSSLAPDEFDALLIKADLFLSANITGTTVAKAITLGIPVIVLHNSVSAFTLEQAEARIGKKLSPAVAQWLKQAAPLEPFTLWPLGYQRFLQPILQDNPYAAALEYVEILDEEQVEAALASLLFNATAREGQIHRQDAYVKQVSALPRGAALVHAGLRA